MNKQNIYYKCLLTKLRFVRYYRKIRVGFWVTEPSKWTQQQFFELLKADKHFEPFILLSYFKRPQGNISPKEHYDMSKAYFEKLDNKIFETYNPDTNTFYELSKYKPDIIFYQQPWLIPEPQMVEKNIKTSLLCYIPYCFYSMNSYVNYLPKFHGAMWKYFVETEFHKKEYEKEYGAKNLFVIGSVKLDAYNTINANNTEKLWKSRDKKRIIYAPHHSFNDNIHEVATFQHNGRFILDLAKNNPNTEWIFRPHPSFIDRVLKNNIMTNTEIEDYYKEWKAIGQVSADENYYEIFKSSDCLITDSISFLSEYAPTGKPVLHLRKDNTESMFNALVSEIDKSYYQIYNNEELAKIFNIVVINGVDELKTARENNKNLLPTNTSASRNIYNYLKKELWI